MSEALQTLKSKLEFFYKEQATVVDPEYKFSLEVKIQETVKKITELEKTVISQMPPTTNTFPADISHIIKYAPAELLGRENETKLLSDIWNQTVRDEPKRPHVFTVVALGGEGKTSLVAKWAAELAGQGWSGCDAVFAWSFYSQGISDQATASSDIFLKEALIFFGDDEDKRFAVSNASAFERGKRLASIIGKRRCILIVDGLEPLQYAPTSPTPGELKDQGIAALLKGLATTSNGLCVITTRYPIADLKAFLGNTMQEEKLSRLSRKAGVHLLQKLGVMGSLRKVIPSADGKEFLNEFEELVEDVKGHALTLNLLGTYLHEAHGGDIRKRDLVKLEEANSEEHGGHAFHVMDAYVMWFKSSGNLTEDNQKGLRALSLLWLVGLFDRPASVECLAALWDPPAIEELTEPLIGISETQRNITLTRLETACLVTVNRDAAGALVSIDSHPLIREYFAKYLRQNTPNAWRAAHRRLYQHLCATAKEDDKPTLEDLQPLYQAVWHGCQAGLQQQACYDIYYSRILRSEEGYSVHYLGAHSSDLGAIACFFEQPWSQVSAELNDKMKAWLLSEAATRLRALGRLTESVYPMRASVENLVELQDWISAAPAASNLSQLQVLLGEVAGAVETAKRALTYADRSSNTFQKIARGAIFAWVLHQSGCQNEASTQFRVADQTQAKYQPDMKYLYNLQGFLYCDFLLADAEREAGKEEESRSKTGKWLYRCQAVKKRAAYNLKLYEKNSQTRPLDIAHNNLILGRSILYQTILQNAGISTLDSCHLDQAVASLRNTNSMHWLPAALLTRAWLRSLTNRSTGPESAESDLNAAWEIAERGPMPLYMADIHIYRTRLFLKAKDYPWDSPQVDLVEARRLIEKHGYLRREKELEYAEQVLQSSKSLSS